MELMLQLLLFLIRNDRMAKFEDLLRAVGEYYQDDPTRAGVVASHLEDGDMYFSVVRYHGKFAKDKEVVCSVKSDDNPYISISILAEKWLAKIGQGQHVQKLKEGQ
jgi:hypothetical protein